MSFMNNVVNKGNTCYHPVNPEKYMGNPEKIICRSSWETSFCKWCDFNPGIIQWASEPIAIPYIDPSQFGKNGKRKKRNYYPDYLIKVKTRTGFDIHLVEVKPYKETIPPKKTVRKKQKTMISEARTWEINTAKWKAAKYYCDRKGWKFKIITERELLIK